MDSNIYEVLQRYRDVYKPNNKLDGITSQNTPMIEPIVEPIIEVSKRPVTKQVIINEKLNEVREFNDKYIEVQKILYGENNDTIKDSLIERYALELQGFKELTRLKRLKRKELLYIKYVNVNGKFGYGGYFVSFDDDTITLMNEYDKLFNISIDDNFIFYQRIV